jgi:hypothetical protein
MCAHGSAVTLDAHIPLCRAGVCSNILVLHLRIEIEHKHAFI